MFRRRPSISTLLATVVEEDDQKIIQLPKDLPVRTGAISCEVEDQGKVVLTPVLDVGRQAKWIAFLDMIAATEPDPDFMNERPLNRPPLERDLFPDD